MDVTTLTHNGKFCGAYVDGILLDARPGVLEAIKENGLTPQTVLLTSMSGEAVACLDDLHVPIGNYGAVPDVSVEQFNVGSKGDRRYGFSITSPTGKLVYAPEFDRVEKSKLKDADLAILDPGDRSETGDGAGLSHRSFTARERMVAKAGVPLVFWSDNTAGETFSVHKKTDLSDNEKMVLNNKSTEDKENSGFLVVEDDGTKHLPTRSNGKADHGLMGAAWAALHGGYRGNKYAGPNKSEAIKKLRALYKSEGMDTPDEQEKSVNLDDLISGVRDAFRKFDFGMPLDTANMYVHSTYDDYVVVCWYGRDYSHDSGHYYKIPYTKSGDDYTFAPFSSWEEVVPEITYTAAKSSLIITKEQDKRSWIAISSSDFRDADDEVVSTQAMDFAIALNKHRNSYGNLVWDHYDELPLGVCKSQMRVGRFLVESGDFDDTLLAQKAADKLEGSKPGEYQISIGFKYWKGTRSDDGVYSLIDIYHRATTTHPANPNTGIEVIKMTKELTAEAKKAIAADLDIPVEELDKMIAGTKKEEKEGSTAEVKHKEEAPDPLVAELKTQIDALTTQLESLKNQLTAVSTDSLKAQESLKSLMSDSPKGKITRPTDSGTPVTEEEKHVLTAQTAEKSQFESFYDLFNSQQLARGAA